MAHVLSHFYNPSLTQLTRLEADSDTNLTSVRYPVGTGSSAIRPGIAL